MNSAELLISQARHGRYREVLPELLALATDPDGEPDPAWEAAAAAIQILFWEDRFAEAAELAETLIARWGSLGGELCDQDMPFDAAFLGAHVHAGLPAGPRLRSAAEHIPEGRILRDALLWCADHVDAEGALWLLPDGNDWGGPVKPRDGVIGAQLLERDFAGLSEREQRVAWEALKATNDFPLARALVELSDEVPEQPYICLWLAGWYAIEGDIARGEKMLLAYHDSWWPYMKWDAIPDSMVLQPTLRPVVTDRVREHYLTRPIGPEAGSDKK